MFNTTYIPSSKLSKRFNSKHWSKSHSFENKVFSQRSNLALDLNRIYSPLSAESLKSIIKLVRNNVVNSLDSNLEASVFFKKEEEVEEDKTDEENEQKQKETIEEEHNFDKRGSIEKLFNFVKFSKNKKTVSFDVDETARDALLNNASFPASTDYGGGGGSDRYGYTTSRTVPRDSRDRNPELREPVEPIDQHHNHHHHHHYRHNRESSIKRGQFTRSLSNTEPPTDEKAGRKLNHSF